MMAADGSMQVTMVKKRLSSGEACRKCIEAEELLRRRGAWSRVSRVVWADEEDPDSEGMALARRYGVEDAPFFIVDDGRGQTPYSSVLRLMRELSDAPPAPQLQRGPMSPSEVEHAQRELAAREPQQVLRFALGRFGEHCAIAFSGAEDVVLIHMASQIGLPFRVFCLDTGRLHAETYRFIDRVRGHYGVEIELMAPATEPLQAFVRKKGLFSFYEDGHQECCAVRKVEPLRRALASCAGWVTGQRRDQSPATRGEVPVVQIDPAFAGVDGAPLIKFNPLSSWSSKQTWSYIREHGIPYNSLHERGFVSIGCEPCTRPIHPGQHEREGRWWWEESTQKECGLHSQVDLVADKPDKAAP